MNVSTLYHVEMYALNGDLIKAWKSKQDIVEQVEYGNVLKLGIVGDIEIYGFAYHKQIKVITRKGYKVRIVNRDMDGTFRVDGNKYNMSDLEVANLEVVQ